MNTLVDIVLETDSNARKTNLINLEDLFFLQDVNYKDWDYSLPTLSSGKSNKIDNDLEKFTKFFYETIPFKLLNMDNILIAGGSISSILRRDSYIKDIDLFLYGLTVEQADARVTSIIKDL